MAQVKLLKVSADGYPIEFDAAADDITLNSFTIQGGGPVLGTTGLDLNAQSITDILNVTFNNSATATITVNSTAFIADDLMFQTKENVMTTAGAVLFPVITDNVNQLDAFRLPAIAGTPTLTPADGGTGYLVYDSTNSKPYVWTGTVWDDLTTVTSAANIDGLYTAAVTLATPEAVYISAADTVDKAKADAPTTAQLIGFISVGGAAAAQVSVRKNGTLAGFTGLTAGVRQYLSPGTAGAITATLPVGTGNIIVQAGYAKNATTLDIQIAQLGRRAV